MIVGSVLCQSITPYVQESTHIPEATTYLYPSNTTLALHRFYGKFKFNGWNLSYHLCKSGGYLNNQNERISRRMKPLSLAKSRIYPVENELTDHRHGQLLASRVLVTRLDMHGGVITTNHIFVNNSLRADASNRLMVTSNVTLAGNVYVNPNTSLNIVTGGQLILESTSVIYLDLSTPSVAGTLIISVDDTITINTGAKLVITANPDQLTTHTLDLLNGSRLIGVFADVQVISTTGTAIGSADINYTPTGFALKFTPNQPSPKPHKKSNAGKIVGILFGVLIAVGIVGFLGYRFMFRRKQTHYESL